MEKEFTKPGVYKFVLNDYDTGEMIDLDDEALKTYEKDKLIHIVKQLCIDLKTKMSQIKAWQGGYEMLVESQKTLLNKIDTGITIERI